MSRGMKRKERDKTLKKWEDQRIKKILRCKCKIGGGDLIVLGPPIKRDLGKMRRATIRGPEKYAVKH